MSERYVIIGDVHGCYDQMYQMVRYAVQTGRKSVFVGDLIDRGPRSKGCLLGALNLVDSGDALMVQGNHDNKFARWCIGNPVKVGPDLRTTIRDFQSFGEFGHTPEYYEALGRRILGLPTQLDLDDGRLRVVHAAPGKKDRNLYGVTTGRYTEDGFPERIDWAAEYEGPPYVVYGHTIVEEPYMTEWSCNVDTGCYRTGLMSALLWPEKEIVQVKLDI